MWHPRLIQIISRVRPSVGVYLSSTHHFDDYSELSRDAQHRLIKIVIKKLFNSVKIQCKDWRQQLIHLASCLDNLTLVLKILFIFVFSSEPSVKSKNLEQSSEDLMMSGTNKRTYSTSSNSSVLSSSYCVTLGVGPLWCSWCNYKRQNWSR